MNVEDLAHFITLINILIQNIIQVFCAFYLYINIKHDWITIMGYCKHELSTINMFDSAPKNVILPPPPPDLPITATPPHNGHFFCLVAVVWRGSTVL